MKKTLLAAACCVLTVAVLGSVAAMSGCGASDMKDSDCRIMQAAISATEDYEGAFTTTMNYTEESSSIIEEDGTYARYYIYDGEYTYSYNWEDRSFVDLESYTRTSTYDYGEDAENTPDDSTSTTVANDFYTDGYHYTYRQYDEDEATKSASEVSYMNSRYLSTYTRVYLGYFGITVDEIYDYFGLGTDEDEDTEETVDPDDYETLTLTVKGSTYTIEVSMRETYDSSYYDSYVSTGLMSMSYTVTNGYITAYTYVYEYGYTQTKDDESYTYSDHQEYTGTITYAYDETLMPSASELATYGN